MDLIDRQAAIDVLAAMQGQCTSKAALIQNSKIWQQIKDLPSAEPKKGKWIETEFLKLRECSCCGARWGVYSIEEFEYCPTCGAKMEE